MPSLGTICRRGHRPGTVDVRPFIIYISESVGRRSRSAAAGGGRMTAARPPPLEGGGRHRPPPREEAAAASDRRRPQAAAAQPPHGRGLGEAAAACPTLARRPTLVPSLPTTAMASHESYTDGYTFELVAQPKLNAPTRRATTRPNSCRAASWAPHPQLVRLPLNTTTSKSARAATR
jgi:hypothetical protein